MEWQRVQCVCGDLAAFSVEHHARTFARVRTIVHCAARVHGLLPYTSLRVANVASTLECLRIPHAHLVFVSSLSAEPAPAEEFMALSEHTIAALPHMSGYGASKRVCELLLGEASRRGFRVSIVRPGTICGDQSTGAYNHNDTLPRLIAAMLHMNAAPQIGTAVAAVDVRRVAALVARTRPGHVYHARGHGSIRVREMAAPLGVPLVPFREWKRALESDAANPLFALRSYFDGGFPLGTEEYWADDAAAALLHPCDASPHLDAAAIAAFGQWLRRTLLVSSCS
eukprot:TRINITY_DN3421_c1_g1_i1.p1 TRINITY_DN3421_c1_g1~~TRINITY_DN3421_c1_g1_i1.p1  ORF type:complete len:283 (-),score=75.75 TRINITY_DN3421_c1_g1_i1:214-1062(-)